MTRLWFFLLIACLTIQFRASEAFCVVPQPSAAVFDAKPVRVSSKLSSFTKRSILRKTLAMSSFDNGEPYSVNPSNIPFGVIWLALLGFAFLIAPGGVDASNMDKGIIQAILDNPQKPDVNELFVFVFNQFGVLPLVLASVTLPQASTKGPTPIPFLIGASLFGYFIFGPYMLLRGSPRLDTKIQDLGWFTCNVLENKLFNAAALILSLFFATQVSWSNFAPLSQGFVDLWSESKLVSVSTVDLSILTLTTAALIPQDYLIRNPHDKNRANLIAMSTLLVPVYGALIYCLLRPKIAED